MRRVARFALCWLMLTSVAAAQKRPASKVSPTSATKLIALKATGTARYTDKEILAASGLQLGQDAADGDFKEAVRRLGDSGLFGDIAYSYSSSSAGVKLELQLTDTDQSKLVPAQFDKLCLVYRRRTADCRSSAAFPCSSSCCRSRAIFPTGSRRLCKRSSPRSAFPDGSITCGRETNPAGRYMRIVYRVEEVSIRIRNFEFPGASPEQAALLASRSAPLHWRKLRTRPLSPPSRNSTCCRYTCSVDI